jgi:predicted GH43/DUF377 family glycosyl hydrolase
LRLGVFLAVIGIALGAQDTPAHLSQKENGRVLFSISPGNIERGEHLGTAFDQGQNGIVLQRAPSGRFPAQGVYLSPMIEVAPAETLRLVWQPRWTTPLVWEKHPGNPVVAGTKGRWDEKNVTTCSIVPIGDRLRMYYGSRGIGIGIAEAPTGDIHHWEKQARPILTTGPASAFDGGGVLSAEVVPVTPTHWHLYYVGYHPTKRHGNTKVHQIGLAQSDDGGLTWTRTSDDPVVAHGPEGSFDGFAISSNSVLYLGDKWYCWYTGISQTPYLSSIGLATSRDGHRWEKYPFNPVMYYNPHIIHEAFMVAKPHVLYEEGVFKMWYTARGMTENRKSGNYSICYAESLDGIHWQRYPGNPVVKPSSTGWDGTMVEYAEVINAGGRYHMWYCGDAYANIGYALGRSLAAINLQIRAGTGVPGNPLWTEWMTPPGMAHQEIFSIKADYVQIRATLTTNDPQLTPILQNLKLIAAPKPQSE